jgi:hypothetical protein
LLASIAKELDVNFYHLLPDGFSNTHFNKDCDIQNGGHKVAIKQDIDFLKNLFEDRLKDKDEIIAQLKDTVGIQNAIIEKLHH